MSASARHPGERQPPTPPKVRNVSFQFDSDTPFQWNPANPWYRLRALPRVFAHVLGCHTVACRGFDEHVPIEARLATAGDIALGWTEIRARIARLLRLPAVPEDQVAHPTQFAEVSRKEILRMIYRLVRSQHPRHPPHTEETPPFADQWLAEYDGGRDVVHWYGV